MVTITTSEICDDYLNGEFIFSLKSGLILSKYFNIENNLSISEENNILEAKSKPF